MANNNSGEFSNTQIAVLLTTCDKYTPGKQTFRLQSLVGLKDNTKQILTTSNKGTNLLNKDKDALPIGDVNTGSVIQIEIPFEISRRYPVKFIPPGTRFLVSFSSGDIKNPIIVGGDF